MDWAGVFQSVICAALMTFWLTVKVARWLVSLMLLAALVLVGWHTATCIQADGFSSTALIAIFRVTIGMGPWTLQTATGILLGWIARKLLKVPPTMSGRRWVAQRGAIRR